MSDITWLIGEFKNTESVAAIVRSLHSAGSTNADIDLFSEEPVELPKGVLERPSRMSLVAVLGAITLGSLATTGVWAAQHNYSLVTGGMPIFSFWGTGVITYETTMMGAVFSTFFWFIWESKLFRKKDPTAPVPVVPPESICVRVRWKGDPAKPEALFHHAGAISVERKAPQ